MHLRDTTSWFLFEISMNICLLRDLKSYVKKLSFYFVHLAFPHYYKSLFFSSNIY